MLVFASFLTFGACFRIGSDFSSSSSSSSSNSRKAEDEDEDEDDYDFFQLNFKTRD